ncbi:MAG: diadenylate cyclase CdaA [Verrucomicrobium sp.]|nr:diadenylate cyclase CdaA [Verrucomicrobium sp.]
MNWPHFQPSWLIEILIISTAIYYIWKLFHGTRGARVLTGLTILLVTLIAVSHFLHLSVVSRILDLFSPSFFIGVVVLFQPELRQILAELGTRPVLSGTRQQSEVIEHIVNALEILQRERLGALIAIEGDDVFAPGRSTGTELRSAVSADLLATLFYPKTPLHDGGVIIRGSEVVVAAAIFPLTQKEHLDRALGLRHRAALGLSEETDAVVVVLSEETGTIALAHRGNLIRPLSPDGLRAELTRILL